MQNRSAKSTEEQPHSGAEKERRGKDASCSSPGVNGCRGRKLCDQQDENVEAAHLAAKDRFEILVPQTKYPKTSNPEKNDNAKHPIDGGADNWLQIVWNSFDFSNFVPPDQGAFLKGHSGQRGECCRREYEQSENPRKMADDRNDKCRILSQKKMGHKGRRHGSNQGLG